MSVVRLFNQYAEERGLGPRLFVIDGVGFATYHLHKEECYIEDIYVIPELRKSGVARKIADSVCEIAKSQDIKMLTGSVNKKANGCDVSRRALLAYGFKKVNEDDTMEWYAKEI